MQLKSVTIHGFKSFPDRTVITFSRGITGIVGPNGSGKSNLSDAIRWVMGETSAKTLRGNKIEDVIFDGTSDRKPLGFAEVSMTLGNADRTLDLPYDDVIITRRYYRTGESEYFINGSGVRLKDIQELLRDTGLGKTGYSVIGQGAITEIIEAKSGERRTLFEEAAGIAGFRHKKDESLRKLEQTRANLARLNDIVSELKSRLGPLERQSANARRFLQLRDEKRELEITLWVRRIDTLESALREAQVRAEVFRGDLERTERDIANRDASIRAAEEECERLTVSVETLRADIRQYEDDVRERQTAILVAQNDILHMEQDITRLRDAIENDEAEKQRTASERDAMIRAKEALENELKRDEAAAVSGRDDVAACEKEQEKAENAIADCEKEMARRTDALTALQIRLGAIAQSIESGDAYIDSRKKEIEDAKKRMDDVRLAAKKAQDDLASVEDKLTTARNMEAGYRLKQKNMTARTEESAARLADLRLKLGDKQNRLNILSGMEAHYDGFQTSVRTVMEEARRGVLRGIEGTVAELISVKEDYTVAVETALGNMLQNIVTVDEKSAKNAIFLLKNRNAGRATFLPLNTVHGSVLQAQGVEREDGFVGIASDLVSCDAKYAEIVRSLLGRTAVAEDLDAATDIAKKYRYGFRIVTLDGQVVNAGGSLTGGSTGKNFGFLSRKNEIEQLRRESETLAASLKKLEAEAKQNGEAMSEIAASLTGLDADIRNLEEQRIRALGEAEHCLAFEKDITAQEEQLAAELDALAETKDRNAAEKELLGKKIAEAEASLAEAASLKADAQAHAETVRAHHNELLEACHAAELGLVEKRKSIEAAAFDIRRLEQSADLLVGDVSKLNDDIARLERGIADKNKEAADLASGKDEADSRVRALGDEIEKAVAARMVEEQKAATLRNDEKELYALRESLVRENEKQAAVLQNGAAERDGIVTKIWEEYEYTPTEARTHCVEIADPDAAADKVNSIKSAMKALGNVNLDAIDEYTEVKTRYDDLTAQVTDLEAADAKLVDMIDGLTGTMKTAFEKSFAVINETFGEVFRELFDGGHAELKLEDPTDILESGIEIYAAPPGKIIKNLMALSGGERSLTAIALYFAILKIRPAPFCLLDEIEAALDEVNVVRYAAYLKRNEKTQFIVITHRRGTMEYADTLYGVTMKEKGISKILSVNIDEAVKQSKEDK